MDVRLSKMPSGRKERKWVKALFLSAFPPEERPPFFVMRLRARQNTDWWLIQSGGKNAGFFYVIRDEDLAYLFFFAVDEAFRGRGIGSKALCQLIRLYEGKTFFLAIEPLDKKADNYSMRVRRLGFYQRNGLVPLNQWIREDKVVYALLGTGGQVPHAAYDRMMQHWLGSFRLLGVTMKIGDGDPLDQQTK